MTTPETVTPLPRRGAPRWLWALLVASLALNLLIVGAFAGHRLGGRWWRGHDGTKFIERMLLRDLPSERREALKGMIGELVDAGREVRKDFADKRRAAAAAFAAEPFDRARFEAAITAMIDDGTLTRTGLVAKMGKLAEAMTPDERARFVRRFRFLRAGPED